MPSRTTTSASGQPTPVYYEGVAIVAGWFGVDAALVTKWITRYADTETPTPAPDALILPGRSGDGDKGWLPERKADWLAWKDSLPGQGAKGRPKPRKTTATVSDATANAA